MLQAAGHDARRPLIQPGAAPGDHRGGVVDGRRERARVSGTQVCIIECRPMGNTSRRSQSETPIASN